MPRLLFIDAYDSFAQNIKALLHQCINNAEITLIKIDSFNKHDNSDDRSSDDAVKENDEKDNPDIDDRETVNPNIEHLLPFYDAIILGPGPGNPQNDSDVGLFNHVWRTASIYGIPVLGICLGFQSLCLYHGIPVSRMHQPCHGLMKQIHSNQQDIFSGVDDVEATNYNSLAVFGSSFAGFEKHSRPSSAGSNESFGSISSDFSKANGTAHRRDIDVLAWDDDGYVMAVKHHDLPFWGLQFHPESCKSNEGCVKLIQNWWKKAQSCNEERERYPFNLTPYLQSSTDRGFFNSDSHKGTASAKANGHNFSSSDSQDPLRSVLQSLDVTNGKVQWVKVPVDLSEEQIAEMCYQHSPKGKTAMLNSTRKGRYSIYAVGDDAWLLEYSSNSATIHFDGRNETHSTMTKAEILQLIEQYVERNKSIDGPNNVPFWGGFLGYVSYEFGLDMINVKSPQHRSRLVPDVSLLWVDRTIIFDNVTSMVYVQSIRKNDDAWVENMTSEIESKQHSKPPSSTPDSINRLETILSSTKISRPDHESYINQILECQEELRSGNSYELCLTTEAQIETPLGENHPYILYRNMHKFNPVPFGAYFDLNEVTILGTSPEQYLCWSRDGVIDMVPMKGTVKHTPDMTLARATEILSTPKESAENLMIADLIRHDLYTTVGATSSVRVAKLCEVIEHETVYQLVSHLQARAPMKEAATPDEVTSASIHYGHKALRSTMPPGSMTGAPKKRSCEILSSLENRNRGIYSGILGFLDVGGGGSWNVCIRSAFSSKKEDRDGVQKWRVGAGGAITILSDPEAEWEEMSTKLDSVLRGFQE